MEFKTKRDIKSEQTREKILEETDALISAYGVSALTIKNLCQKAKISNGTFFHYYDSKDTLIAAYMHYSYDRYTLTHPFVDDPDDHIKNIIDTHIHNILYAKILGVEFTRCYYNINNPNLRNRGNLGAEKYSRYILEQVTRSLECGFLKSELSVDSVSADICMVAKGVIFEWGLCGDAFDVEAYLSKMLKIYLRSVVTDKYTGIYPDTLSC